MYLRGEGNKNKKAYNKTIYININYCCYILFDVFNWLLTCYRKHYCRKKTKVIILLYKREIHKRLKQNMIGITLNISLLRESLLID